MKQLADSSKYIFRYHYKNNVGRGLKNQPGYSGYGSCPKDKFIDKRDKALNERKKREIVINIREQAINISNRAINRAIRIAEQAVNIDDQGSKMTNIDDKGINMTNIDDQGIKMTNIIGDIDNKAKKAVDIAGHVINEPEHFINKSERVNQERVNQKCVDQKIVNHESVNQAGVDQKKVNLTNKLSKSGETNNGLYRFLKNFLTGLSYLPGYVRIPGFAGLLTVLLLLISVVVTVPGSDSGMLSGNGLSANLGLIDNNVLSADFGLVDNNVLAANLGLIDNRVPAADFGLVDYSGLLAADFSLAGDGEPTPGYGVVGGSDSRAGYGLAGVGGRKLNTDFGLAGDRGFTAGFGPVSGLRVSFDPESGMSGVFGLNNSKSGLFGLESGMPVAFGLESGMTGITKMKDWRSGVSGREIDRKTQSGQWRTLMTENFEVHFQAELEALAVRSAEIAEEIHEAIADDYQPGRGEKTHLIVVDDSDMASGVSDPSLLDQIIINPSHPVMREFGGRHESWLKLLIAHEYTHILHLNMRSETLEALRGLLGDVPNMMNPNFFQTWWMIEGYPILEETGLSGGGRAQDAVYDMYLRMAFLEDEVYHFDQIHGQYNLESWPPGGMSVYLYGANFFDYLVREHSREELIEVSKVYAGNPSKGIDESFEEALGELAQELFQDWKRDRLEEYESQAAAIRAEGEVTGERLSEAGYYSYRPGWDPSREEVVYYHLGNYYPGLRGFDLETGQDRHLKSGYLVPTGLEITAEGEIIYASAEEDYFDIYRFDPESGIEDRLTEGKRSRDPVMLGTDELIYINQQAGMTEVRKKMIDNEVDGEAEVLLGPGEKRQYFSPAVDPGENLLALVIWKPGGYQDLYIYDLKEERLLRITENREAVFSPTWTPEGDRILFHADKDGVHNLYAYDLREEAFYQVTNVVGGAFDPLVIEDKEKLVYVGYDSYGYNLYALDYAPDDWQPVDFPGGAVNRETDRGLMDLIDRELRDQAGDLSRAEGSEIAVNRAAGGQENVRRTAGSREAVSQEGENQGFMSGTAGDQKDVSRAGEDQKDVNQTGQKQEDEGMPEEIISGEDRDREELEIRDYSIFRYLAPRFYVPNFMIGTAGGNLGLTIGGRDPLDWINYQAGFSFEGPDYPLGFHWSVLFDFDDFQFRQSSQRITGRRFRDDERKLEDTHLLQLVVPVQEQVFSAAALSGGVLYFRRSFETERPVQEQYRGFAAGNYLQSWGRNDLFALRNLYFQGNLDYFEDQYYLSTQMDWREFLDWRDYELNLRGSLAFGQYEESFTLGGLVGRYPVRGYSTAERVPGSELYYLRGQLSRTLVNIKRGVGLSPVFFDNLSATLFLDGGRISTPEEEKWLAGAGGELSLDLELSYGLYPLELNLGAARKLAEDDWQIYLTTGYTF